MINEEKLDAILHLVTKIQERQEEIRLEIKEDIHKLAQIQNDDIVTIAQTSSAIRHTLHAMQDDMSFLVRKTMENNEDIRKLKIVK